MPLLVAINDQHITLAHLCHLFPGLQSALRTCPYQSSHSSDLLEASTKLDFLPRARTLRRESRAPRGETSSDTMCRWWNELVARPSWQSVKNGA